MELEGQIEDIIYQNDVNGYCIATFTTVEEDLTIVGYLPFIHVGDALKVIGKFVTHKDYGRQFKVETFEKLMPQTLDALEKYLANGAVKGIGPATAEKIIKIFGEETISVFKFEPEKLSQIKGISKQKAIEIAEDFNEKWDLWQIVSFLEKFGIGPQNSKRIYDTLGKDAVQQIEENPYVLVDVSRSVDFKQIDKIALDMGYEYDNPKRIKSGIKYSLLSTGYNGNCCTQKEKLMQHVQELLAADKESIEDELINLNLKNEIVIENREEEEFIYLSSFYQAEKNIATKIVKLNRADNSKKINNFKKILSDVEKLSSIKLSDKQKEALEAINENNVCVITGGPGTGKTTIIRNIIEMYKIHGKKTVLCAPTGRAAKRMTEATGEEAKTLHRLLEIGKIQDDGDYHEIDYDVTPIDADVVVVDEMSMVDLFLMNYLLNAIFQGSKLVLVGDVNQLPSVGPGSVLKDLIASETISTVFLNKVFRQAAKSKIIVNAHRVNSGESFINKEEQEFEGQKLEEMQEDFFYINENNQDKILYHVVSLCKERLKNFGDYEFFKNIQILTPTKKGMLGTKELNETLQQELNPASDTKKEKQNIAVTYREGDKVMQIKNNYDIFWERKQPVYETGSGIFNGELGTIDRIDEVEKQVKVIFDDDKMAWYAFSELDQIEHSYAITIHKAQR